MPEPPLLPGHARHHCVRSAACCSFRWSGRVRRRIPGQWASALRRYAVPAGTRPGRNRCTVTLHASQSRYPGAGCGLPQGGVGDGPHVAKRICRLYHHARRAVLVGGPGGPHGGSRELFDTCLHSLRLLPVLAVIAADGPCRASQRDVLMSAAAPPSGSTTSAGSSTLRRRPRRLGRGDLFVFCLGRSSDRLLPAAAPTFAAWPTGCGRTSSAARSSRSWARMLPGGRLGPRPPVVSACPPLPPGSAAPRHGAPYITVSMLLVARRRQPAPEPRRRYRHGGARQRLRGRRVRARRQRRLGRRPPARRGTCGSRARHPDARLPVVAAKSTRHRHRVVDDGARWFGHVSPGRRPVPAELRSTGTGQSLNARERRWL